MQHAILRLKEMKTTCKICGIVDKPHHCPHIKRKTDRTRKDKQVYSKHLWQRIRLDILDTYGYICLWSLYIDGEIIAAKTVHHIVEIMDDDSLAFDNDNLIPLSKAAHEIVHKLYREGKKEQTQQLLRDMQKAYLSGNKTLGYYKSKI